MESIKLARMNIGPILCRFWYTSTKSIENGAEPKIGALSVWQKIRQATLNRVHRCTVTLVLPFTLLGEFEPALSAMGGELVCTVSAACENTAAALPKPQLFVRQAKHNCSRRSIPNVAYSSRTGRSNSVL